MENFKKIFIFTFPYTGHCNPIFGICKRLKEKNPNIQIYAYSDYKFKNSFESCGVTFRSYKVNISDENWPNNINGFQIGYYGLKISDKIMHDLKNDVLADRPDLILYDKSALYTRFCIDFIITQYEMKQINLFKIIGYSTMPQIDKYYPNNTEIKQLNLNPIKFIYYALLLIILKYRFYLKHDIKNKSLSIWSSFDQIQNEKTIVFTFPQFQPRSHLRDNKKFVFVGSSIDENIHFNGIDESVEISNEIKYLLNSTDLQSEKLIYVSLGTIFNRDQNINVYLKIINALKIINDKIKIKAIIATGDKCFSLLKSNLDSTSDKIILVEKAPQIEILKKASLFITHSGMNSTSESIYYGVPMICLPIATATDQPLIAYRIADELGLGLRLNSKSFKVNELIKSILKILNDSSFYERCKIYQMISKRYNGIDNSVKIIEHILMK